MSKNLKLTALILSAVMAVSCIPANIFAGNRTGMIKDGTTTTYGFNILNQLISSGSQVTLSDSARALTHSYTYNANGDLISDTEVRPLDDFTEELQQYPEYYISGNLTKTTDRSYSYDSAGRLTDTENVSTIEGTIPSLRISTET